MIIYFYFSYYTLFNFSSNNNNNFSLSPSKVDQMAKLQYNLNVYALNNLNYDAYITPVEYSSQIFGIIRGIKNRYVAEAMVARTITILVI